MSSIRKNPPQPMPSRIAGTLKVKKPAAGESEVPPAGDAAAPAPAPARARARDEKSRPADRKEDRPAAPAGRSRQAREEGPAPASRRSPRSEEARSAKPERPRGPKPAGKPPVRDAARPAPAAKARPVERAEPSPARAPRPEGAPPEGVRLSKVMAERGICSRREADELIERGWVFVDGKRVSELGVRIDPAASITLAPEAKREQAQRVTILLHKPVGYVSGQPEPGYEPAVSLIGADNQFDRDSAQRFHPSNLKNLAPAGRLDIDSTGLLVLTQDGRIARQLIGDDSQIDKEYLVRVEGSLLPDGLALLNEGLELDGRRLRPAKVEWLNDDQLRFVLREGRKRQIRRMCELVGLKVTGLKRVRIGRVKLGDLPLGQWRYLRDDEAF
ncbi:MAG: pseudouridine synthase [Thauera sp.]|nr:pseudouridine synthase [Thauera sp.]